MHVDMDCFFASVAVRNRPELRGIPLAIAHSNNSAGHSEISCVNYVARSCGVRADMWMASARERCALLPPCNCILPRPSRHSPGCLAPASAGKPPGWDMAALKIAATRMRVRRAPMAQLNPLAVQVAALHCPADPARTNAASRLNVRAVILLRTSACKAKHSRALPTSAACKQALNPRPVV